MSILLPLFTALTNFPSWPWLLLLPLLLFLRSLFPRRSRLPLPPGPRPWPILGNLPQLASDSLTHQVLAKLANVYGPIMSLRLGSIFSVVVSDPDTAKEVLKEFDAVTSSRLLPESLRILSHGGKNVVFAPTGPHLKMVRRVCAMNLFNKKQYEIFKPMRLFEVQKMCEAIKETVESTGGLVGLRNIICQTSLNHQMRICIGKRFELSVPGRQNVESDKFFQWMEETFAKLGGVSISDVVPILRLFDPDGLLATSRRLSREFAIFFSIPIKEHEKKLEDAKMNNGGEIPMPQDLCDALLLAREMEPLDFETILLIIQDMVVGGSDTSAVSVEWAMLELISKPEKLARLQIEVDSVFKAQNLENSGNSQNSSNAFPDIETRLLELPYLKSVVKETLRMHPAVPMLIPHATTEPVKLGKGKYEVPAGTMVQINVWAISRDERFWGDPLEFKPERFLESNGDLKNNLEFRGNNFSFLPFGSGRRMCPGLNIGSAMVSLMIAFLVHKFDWSPGVEKIDKTEKMGLTISPLKPLEVVAVPRT